MLKLHGLTSQTAPLEMGCTRLQAVNAASLIGSLPGDRIGLAETLLSLWAKSRCNTIERKRALRLVCCEQENLNVEKATLWARVGHWLRPSVRPGEPDRFPPTDPPLGPIGGGSMASTDTGIIPSDGSSVGPKFRLARTGSAIDRLEEEYARVIKIVESVEKHLELQSERGESMTGAMNRLAENLEHMPETSKTQVELLSTMNHQMGVDGACIKRVDENLSQLPRLADAQRETMVSIGRQLDLSRQTGDRVGTALEGFQQAVTLLGEATGASAKALQELRWNASAREERVATLLQEQTRRLTFFAVAAVGASVVAAVIGIIALLR